MRLFVAQDGVGPPVTAADSPVTGSVRVSFGTPAVVTAVLAEAGVTASPACDSASIGLFGDHAELTLASLGRPILLATFTLTGLAAGTTLLTAAELDPTTPDFITASGVVLDPIGTASASLAVRAVAVVPEPSSLPLGASVALLILGGLRWRGRAAVPPRRDRRA